MDKHDWILEILRGLAQDAESRRMGLAAHRLRVVAGVYATEVSSTEAERNKGAKHLVSNITPIKGTQAGRGETTYCNLLEFHR